MAKLIKIMQDREKQKKKGDRRKETKNLLA